MRFHACLATSLDGKINPPGERQAVSLGTAQDRLHLQTLRQEADVLLFGGQTFRSYPKPHAALSDSHRPTHGIITRGEAITRQLPPESPLFTLPASEAPPVMVFSARPVPSCDRAHYPAWVVWHVACGDPSAQVAAMASVLAAHGLSRPLVEGGGEIVGLFAQARALSRLYLTLCPLLLGGDAPSLLSGVGFSRESAPRARIAALRHVGDEIFLTLELDYTDETLNTAC